MSAILQTWEVFTALQTVALQCELRRVTSVTSVSYLGPPSTNIWSDGTKCAQPVCSIFFDSAAVWCVFLYKRLQTKQQTVDRNVFAWPSCNGQAIASWTLSFHLVLVHLVLVAVLVVVASARVVVVRRAAPALPACLSNPGCTALLLSGAVVISSKLQDVIKSKPN